MKHKRLKKKKSNSLLNWNACSSETFCLHLAAYEQNSNYWFKDSTSL